MKHGKLFFDSELDRINVIFDDGSYGDGFHAGDVIVDILSYRIWANSCKYRNAQIKKLLKILQKLKNGDIIKAQSNR